MLKDGKNKSIKMKRWMLKEIKNEKWKMKNGSEIK